MTITANTKIAAIIKHHPGALDAIISISSAFEKLRNPLLRKLMAGRTSIAMASKIGGCTLQSFFNTLKPLGFQIDVEILPVAAVKKELPGFLLTLKNEQLFELDVRPIIASGNDPLNAILEKINAVKAGQVLKIINSFEPVPLIKLLEKQGFEAYADLVNEQLVETWFYKTITVEKSSEITSLPVAINWMETLQRFDGKIQSIDVRHLEMPLPMITILEALDTLPRDHALRVFHKRIPVFLLPELAERKFDYCINETSDAGVQLLIFKP